MTHAERLEQEQPANRGHVALGIASCEAATESETHGNTTGGTRMHPLSVTCKDRAFRDGPENERDELPKLAEPWPEMESFEDHNLPQFPADVLPDVLRRWVQAEAHATQTPADLPGLLALAVCSATIARRIYVEPQAGWIEPTNLYVAVLLGPANRKSAVFADATKPLRDVEADEIAASRASVARAQSERRQLQARLQKLERSAGESGDADSAREARELAEKLAQEAEPVLPRRIADDATVEKLGMLLCQHGGRMASMSAEGGVFDMMAGRYSKNNAPQFDIYLKGHSGDDLITDRVSREEVRIQRPALTCAFAVQPAVIQGLASNPVFRNRGLLGRFLYASPRSRIGERDVAPAPVPDSVREAYLHVVRQLASLDDEVVLRLSPAASNAFRDWQREVEAMLAEGGDLELVQDWGGKLAGQTARLAAVMHCVEHDVTGDIDEQSIAAAISIARYLIPHARAVMKSMCAAERPAESGGQYVLRWIRRHDRKEFQKRDVHQHGKQRFPRASDIDPVLDELVRRNYIRPLPVERTSAGRPPSPCYEVNPAFWQDSGTVQRSRNSHSRTCEPEVARSGNIGNDFGPSQCDSEPEREVLTL